MLWTKRAHQSPIFQTFEWSNESWPNSSCHFCDRKVRVYSNFTLLFAVMKDNSSVFLKLKPCILWTKNAHRKEIFRLLSGWFKFSKFLMSYLEPQLSSSLNFALFFSVMRDDYVILFSWNFIWFGQKGGQMKFHQVCTLIGSFCWKYIKFQLKKYREFMSHDTEDWSKIYCFKNDKNLVNFGLSTRNSQNFYFDWFILCKVYNVSPKKVQRSCLSWHWRVMQNVKKNWLVV